MWLLELLLATYSPDCYRLALLEEEADDDEESDDDSVDSSVSSASEDVPAAKPIDISCFLGHKRPLLLLEKRTISDDDFACGFIDGLEGLDFA